MTGDRQEAPGQKHRVDRWCQANKFFLSILVIMQICEDILRISHLKKNFDSKLILRFH